MEETIPNHLPPLSQLERLEIDIDTRLLGLRLEAASVADWTLKAVAAFRRAVYGRGYGDTVQASDPGKL